MFPFRPVFIIRFIRGTHVFPYISPEISRNLQIPVRNNVEANAANIAPGVFRRGWFLSKYLKFKWF